MANSGPAGLACQGGRRVCQAAPKLLAAKPSATIAPEPGPSLICLRSGRADWFESHTAVAGECDGVLGSDPDVNWPGRDLPGIFVEPVGELPPQALAALPRCDHQMSQLQVVSVVVDPHLPICDQGVGRLQEMSQLVVGTKLTHEVVAGHRIMPHRPQAILSLRQPPGQETRIPGPGGPQPGLTQHSLPSLASWHRASLRSARRW